MAIFRLAEEEGIPGGPAEPDGGGQDEGGDGAAPRPDGALALALRVAAPLGADAAHQGQEAAAAQVSTHSQYRVTILEG